MEPDSEIMRFIIDRARRRYEEYTKDERSMVLHGDGAVLPGLGIITAKSSFRPADAYQCGNCGGSRRMNLDRVRVADRH